MGKGRRSRNQRRRGARLVRRARDQQGHDLFGLEREALITASNVRSVFTPHQPVSETALLFGRQQEVRMLVQTLNTPGQHVLLYGERGVGKSSLANVVADVVKASMGLSLFVKRCDHSDTFETIVQGPLAAVGADRSATEISESTGSSRGAGFASGVFSGKADRTRATSTTYHSYETLSPSSVATALHELDAVFLIDESDAISAPEDRKKLAELIKQLSDSSSSFKLMVVGIAQTGDELTAAHPSVQRCLRETKLRRMADDELKDIVTSGAQALNLKFSNDVVDSIVRLSDGYPHFTHLLALKCAEEAIAGERKEVGRGDLTEALKLAVTDAEGTLRRVYDNSIRSRVEMYRTIVVAAASIGSEEFSAGELRKSISESLGEEISQNALNNYYQRLVSEDGSTIFRRTAHGHYRFEDPRMASFVRISNHML